VAKFNDTAGIADIAVDCMAAIVVKATVVGKADTFVAAVVVGDGFVDLSSDFSALFSSDSKMIIIFDILWTFEE